MYSINQNISFIRDKIVFGVTDPALQEIPFRDICTVAESSKIHAKAILSSSDNYVYEVKIKKDIENCQFHGTSHDKRKGTPSVKIAINAIG
jgi:hypothetical protein